MSRTCGFASRAVALVFGSILAGAGLASAQTTNLSTLNNNGFWSVTNNWSPATNYPNSVGAVAIVTNNIGSDYTLYLTNDITLGTLFWGDADRGNFRGLRTTNAAPNKITFDSGDGGQALFVHQTGDLPAGNFGRNDDRTDVGILVATRRGCSSTTSRISISGAWTTARAPIPRGPSTAVATT